jgi:chemotaxis signal transduction protein
MWTHREMTQEEGLLSVNFVSFRLQFGISLLNVSEIRRMQSPTTLSDATDCRQFQLSVQEWHGCAP